MRPPPGELRRTSELRITLVAREPYLTIRPRLYESDPQEARVRIDELLDSIGVELVMGDVTRIDTFTRTVAVDTTGGRATARR